MSDSSEAFNYFSSKISKQEYGITREKFKSNLKAMNWNLRKKNSFIFLTRENRPRECRIYDNNCKIYTKLKDTSINEFQKKYIENGKLYHDYCVHGPKDFIENIKKKKIFNNKSFSKECFAVQTNVNALNMKNSINISKNFRLDSHSIPTCESLYPHSILKNSKTSVSKESTISNQLYGPNKQIKLSQDKKLITFDLSNHLTIKSQLSKEQRSSIKKNEKVKIILHINQFNMKPSDFRFKKKLNKITLESHNIKTNVVNNYYNYYSLDSRYMNTVYMNIFDKYAKLNWKCPVLDMKNVTIIYPKKNVKL
ncbi:hypothetical protein A3Q56_03511 [Intoshia linei]|uniref:Uncharacterized protein n=1 Tax=Intoshia linei TaxID=1819745 RepID=A0A177B377_9BILA|nr:hypothetical protein A3Q56_03511 [Intoshia linei]